jgi:short-subunit dehydrogenase
MNNLTKKALMLAAAGVGGWLAVRAYRTWNGYDLRGKNVLVTGGSRGLGLVLARQLVHEGANVIICARDQAELDRAKNDLTAHGGHVLAVPCDVTNRDQVQEMVDTIHDYLGPVHVLINNAGVIAVGPQDTMTLEDYEEAMRTNYWAALYTTLAVLPEMRQRREGRLVNITSIGGKLSMPHLIPYNASKFALVGLSEGLRAELAQDGVVVTTVCPGLMRTGSPRNATFKGQHRAEYTWFSISDALPFTSMSAESAARGIIAACKRGDAEVILSLPAKCAALFHGLFPGLTADLLGLVNRWVLPASGGIGTDRAKGKESQSALSPSWLTALSDQAARQNNQIAPEERVRNGRGAAGSPA